MAQRRAGAVGLKRMIVCSVLAVLGLAAAAQPVLAQATNRTIFVGHYFPEGSIASLGVNPDGTVTLLGVTPVGEWIQWIALSPSGRWLAAASGTSNTIEEPIYIFRVNADASLTHVFSGVVPDSPLAMAWMTDDILAVTQTSFSAAGSRIGMYRWTPQGAFGSELNEVDRQVSGGFNSALAHHRGSNYLYTQSTGPNYIERWLVNPSGTLTFSGRTDTPAYPLGPTISPNGRFFYAGGGISAGRNQLLAYTVDEAAGGLTPVSGMPFLTPGNSPAWLAVSADNRILLVAHGTDSTVRSFFIAPDGSLTYTGHSFLVQPLQGAIGELAVLNDVVYVTDDFSAIDGIQGIYALRLGADGSFTQLAPILYTAPRPEGGMVIWNPTDVCPADFDGNSQVNSLDLSAFITRWLEDLATGSRYSDFNQDGTVNSQDISAFVAAWLQAITSGCS